MKAEQEITSILDEMMSAWNNEDQAGYLDHYWKSDQMHWSVKGAWYQGWDSMEQAFASGFLPGAMGSVSIFDVNVLMVADDVGVAYYPWEHRFSSEVLAGSATQVFRKIDGAWKIVHENVARVPAATSH